MDLARNFFINLNFCINPQFFTFCKTVGVIYYIDRINNSTIWLLENIIERKFCGKTYKEMELHLESREHFSLFEEFSVIIDTS